MKRHLLYIFLFFLLGCFELKASDPLSIAVTLANNTNCTSAQCNYSGPSILINEVMIVPAVPYDGSIYGGFPCITTKPQGEWIELYNPNICEPVDISGYFLGNSTEDNSASTCHLVSNLGAAFVIPDGTIIPPNGFCVLRGVNAASVPSNLLVKNGGNTVELVVSDYSDRFCLATEASRFWMPDAGGWFAFYNKEGVPQDAISWTDDDTVPCADCTPCNPGITGTYAGVLSSLSNIPASRQTKICSADMTLDDTYVNKTLKRIPDGQNWQVNQAFTPTMGTCNTTCVSQPSTNCNGTATLTVTGGSGSYLYQWGDASHQTTATATNLCKGTYSVYVKDNVTGITQVASIIVGEDKPIANAGSDVTICMGNSTEIGTTSVVPSYTYQWTPSATLSSSVISNPIAEPTQSTVYTLLVTDNITSCFNSDEVTVQVKDPVRYPKTVSICTGESYNFYGTPLTTSGVYKDTLNGCDSIITLTLKVHNTVYATRIDEFCANEKYIFGDEALTTAGVYTKTFVSSVGCDSVVTLHLSAKEIKYSSFSEEICQGETYNFYNTLLSKTGDYTNTQNSVNGCDSIITLHLIVKPTYTSNQTIPILWGETYTINGHVYSKAGTYTDEMKAVNGCDSTVVTTIEMIYSHCPAVVIPNYFSPNGDGINDFFEIENISCYLKAYVEIYDRYSKLLARYSSAERGWDGTYKGNPMPTTDYWYVVVIPETMSRYKGHFLLRR